MRQQAGIDDAPRVPGVSPQRVLGHVRGASPGPTLICIGGIHGNEPAGVDGLRRVLQALTDDGVAISGEFVALAGNLTALAGGRRFVGRDLNRAWSAERMQSLEERSGGPDPTPEDREQRELLGAIDQATANARGTVYVLDLHTTSGRGGAFTAAGDTLRNRAFALSLEVPFVLGLEELVDGTLLDYLGGRGFTAALFEGGQHGEPEAVDRVEAAVWIALESAGLISEDQAPQVARGRRRLAREAGDKPPVLEMRYRHGIESGSRFEMKPGYQNFERVRVGEVLGTSVGGDVRSPEAGRILMPLYQEQGEDGFFIVRSFHPAWLKVSAVLRRLKVDRVVHWLPGVRRHPTRPSTLVADKHIARWYALEFLHLLGYRRKTEEAGLLVMDRRAEPLGS